MYNPRRDRWRRVRKREGRLTDQCHYSCRVLHHERNKCWYVCAGGRKRTELNGNNLY